MERSGGVGYIGVRWKGSYAQVKGTEGACCGVSQHSKVPPHYPNHMMIKY